VVEFGEWLCTEVLKYVPHRQWVFSIPKRLRIYFMFDRKLLTKLSRCAWKVLNLYLTHAIDNDDAKAGAAVAVQSFGDFQNFHPHLHVLATDGCFYNDDAFMVCPPPDTGELEKLFRYEVFKMLKAEGKINAVVIENMMNWPPARRAYRAYASESATADSMCIAAMPSGPIMKRALKRSSNTWTYGMSSVNRLRDPMTRLPNPLSFMMSPHRPVRMIRLRYCCFGKTSQSSVLLLRRDKLPDRC
jgi:hypothetical protein